MTRRLFREPGDWADLRAGFQWNIPPRFNIGTACTDHWQALKPDALAIRHIAADGHADDWSYRRLTRAVNAFANVLTGLGVKPGDRVAAVLPQGPAVMISHLAAMKLGAVALPLFGLFGADALAYRLKDAGARALVTDAESLGKITDIWPGLPDLAWVFCLDAARPPVRNFWDDIGAASANFEPRDTSAEDPAVMIYTSGTTGPPKGALHAHRFLYGHLPSLELTHGYFPKTNDIGWTPADWAWIGGLMDMAVPCLYYGVPLIAHRMRKFDPEVAWSLIAGQRVTNLFLPPTALRLMAEASAPGSLAVRSISSGGESLGAALLDWGQTTLGVGIAEIYGQTECNLSIASVPGLMKIKPGAMGQAVPGFDIRVVDAAGKECPAGEIGEIAVRRGTPVMFLEYWGQPEKTAKKFSGDWMRTGDLGWCDGDGYFTFHARDDDVITTSGYRVGPSEIEDCLTGDDEVVMAAVVGLPDPVRTEAIKAYVVLAEGTARDGLEARLMARVRKRLSPHLVPRAIEVLDRLPMTATGKILRRELRDKG